MPGPRSIRELLAPRFAVRGGHGLRLGRALLPKIDREHYHRPYRQKLALTVLKRLELEARGAQVLEHRNRTPAVLQLLLAVSLGTTEGVQAK